jgi:L-alanine-DL-glutamate epimerase-like enolase superfamily enzyme
LVFWIAHVVVNKSNGCRGLFDRRQVSAISHDLEACAAERSGVDDRHYVIGRYRVDRTSAAVSDAARSLGAGGYTALKFDPFGLPWRIQDRRDEDLSIDTVAAVRHAVGTEVDLMMDRRSGDELAGLLERADDHAGHHR